MCVHKNQRGKFVGKISASPSGEKKRKKKIINLILKNPSPLPLSLFLSGDKNLFPTR